MSGGTCFDFVHQQALSGHQMGQVGPELGFGEADRRCCLPGEQHPRRDGEGTAVQPFLWPCGPECPCGKPGNLNGPWSSAPSSHKSESRPPDGFWLALWRGQVVSRAL
ncbi:hypothetical protein E5288_WYG005015 [Bos mutus]|uniref:Uncharacterized protein n=1 Tax=Bos mutus TaxID=72004 RepID=A0A6B0QZ11_9CETA|nr:hypothetical protein [Bos mutus]